MIRVLVVVVAFVGLGRLQAARAAVFSRDWKTPGDGLLTYDDVNRREWLDLTQSRLSSVPGVGFEGRFQNLLAELGSGGMYHGFAAAKSADLTSLAESAGLNTSTSLYLVNGVAVENLIALVGISYGPSSLATVASFGLLDELRGPPAAPPYGRLSGRLQSIPTSGASGAAQLIMGPGVGDLATISNTGVWLYRQVPEPNSLAIQVVAMWWLCKYRSRR